MKKLFFATVTAVMALTAQAQVDIYPIPQQVTWGDKVAPAKPRIVKGKKGDKAVAKYAKMIPDHAEGYYLKITPKEVIIAGADEAGTYYGMQTYQQIAGQPGAKTCEITDWPTIVERGVIEGFYGNPWSHEDRLRQFEFYGKYKMNTYIYGPKDDPYHRNNWRVPYPEADAKRLAELNEAARKNHVKFVWAIHPGRDIKWCKEDSVNIIKKLETVYNIGIRNFAVFFDDIWGEGAKGEKQAGLLNYITDEFVHKHPGVSPLIMCPTEYNKSWSGKVYLPTLGKETNPEVRIMWTGATVVDMINEEDVDWFKNMTGRAPYIWLNWPVSDYCTDHMLMGATYGNDKTIGEKLTGFMSNPMEYAEASLVALFSIADYSWNPKAYDEQKSWQTAVQRLAPGMEWAFQKFCDYNTDLGPNGHGLRRYEESTVLKELIKNGDIKLINQEFHNIEVAARTLFEAEQTPLMKEIAPWAHSMMILGMKGQLATAFRAAIDSDNEWAARTCYLNISDLQSQQDAIRSRDFEGSIKKPCPKVGTLVAEPYIKGLVRSSIADYKAKWGNPIMNGKAVFPENVIDDGQYYIVCNGMRLTDKDANPDLTGDAPVFVEYNDTINPQRQIWNVKMDMETERYQITNAQDGRYINELGRFWRTKNNKYNAAWNTFTLKKMEDGKFSIQNGGNGGKDFFEVKNGELSRTKEEAPIFEFIKVK